MPKFQTPKDFINTIHQNKELITQLFDNRKISLELNNLLNTLDSRTEERLPYLIDNDIVNLSGGIISLNDVLAELIENFLGAETIIDIEKAQRLINEIKDNRQYFFAETKASKRTEYLTGVKRSLRQAGKVIVQQIQLLQANVKDVYETETNFKNKLAKLEKFSKQWSIIRQLYEELNRILKDEIFFKNAMDNELQDIVIEVRKHLNIITDNLVIIQATIVNYLNKARQENIKTIHFQRVKALRDSANLKAKSNLIEVLERENSLFFMSNIDVKTKISLDFLETDDGYQIILRANKKEDAKYILNSKIAPAIDAAFLQNKTLDESIINLETLKDSYTAQGGDLFKFIQNYDFKYPVSYNKRISLFCKMISFYHNDLIISPELKTDNNEVSYAMITPKNKN